jgi:S-adenosylmethionine:diacylglycerol 3-amino-3-carboxypropyl transferase
MKKSSLLLSFLILFQSCFSYKTVDYNSIPIEKKQKVEVKGVGGTNIKGTLVSKNEQILTVDTNGQLQKIPVSEIYEVKVRKFSILKTAVRFAAAYGALVVIALSAGDLN